MHRNKSQMTQRGISLLEVLITLVVLAFGVTALVRFQGTLLQHTSVVKQQAEAVILAQKKFETMRHFEVLPTTTGLDAYDDIASGSEVNVGSNTTYTLTWTVTENTAPDYKTVDMSVTWTDRTGVSHSVALTSIISKADPMLPGLLMQ